MNPKRDSGNYLKSKRASSHRTDSVQIEFILHFGEGELEQIQFLLGLVSIEPTGKYLGCKQRFQNAVNDVIGLDRVSS